MSPFKKQFYLALPIIFFYLVFSYLIPYLTADELNQSAYHWENLLFYIPTLCFVLGIVSGFKYGLGPAFLIWIALFFPLSFIHYGQIWGLLPVYLIVACLGLLTGYLISRFWKKRKSNLQA